MSCDSRNMNGGTMQMRRIMSDIIIIATEPEQENVEKMED